MSPSYTGQISGLKVTEEINGAHPLPFHKNYPLLPGDLLVEREDGTFYKFGPGLGIEGFVLTDVQRATLEPADDVPFAMSGLVEFLSGEESP